LSGQELAAALAILAGASLVQALAGFGFALLAMPLLSVVIGPTPALATVSLVSIVNSGATALTARHEADRRSVKRQSIAAFFGMPLGLVVLESVPERGMQALIAVSVALAATALALHFRLPHVGARTEAVAGFTSGALATSTGTSGPPIVICLQSRALPAATVRATLASQFLATGWVSVVLLALRGHIDRDDVELAVLAIPVLLVSWQVGAHSFRRISQDRYDAIVVALLLGAATVAMFQAW
jgi:uncharacterized membrane protein YfcA